LIQAKLKEYHKLNENFSYDKTEHDRLMHKKNKIVQAKVDPLVKEQNKNLEQAIKDGTAFIPKTYEALLAMAKKEAKLPEAEEVRLKMLENKLQKRNQALTDLLYVHNKVNNNNRILTNENFKLSRQKGAKDKENKQQIEMNERCIVAGNELVSKIEQEIPQEITNHTTKGLLPTSVHLPLAKHPQDPGINLEKLLSACAKLSNDKVPYQKLGRWNCSSTTAHILQQSLTDPKLQQKFGPNRLLPYTPQQVYNRVMHTGASITKSTGDLIMQRKGVNKESTLHDARSFSFISMIVNLGRWIRNTVKGTPHKSHQERIQAASAPIVKPAAPVPIDQPKRKDTKKP
jgi:hypothetical protein